MTPINTLASTLLVALVATTTVMTSTAHASKGGKGHGYGTRHSDGAREQGARQYQRGGFSSGYSMGSGYIAIDGSYLNINTPASEQLNPKGARFRLGVQLNEVLDIEAHLGGASTKDIDVFDEFSAAYFGLYLKAYQPIGRYSALFAMAGGSSVELTQSINGQQFSDDRGGFSYGFGLETQLSRTMDLTADYVRYTLDDDEFSEVSAFNLGLKWHF